ncbi:patatin-like phospholipase family protein [Variovorax robiniae]|uniref:Patatin-like phospholipase family protein n=1 Tax=Variovorax robiniae TaxID=1836199 RepID=A0ABU8XCT0_9BURK
MVLGSGGVRSLAALGLIEVLWREGIAPDLVVGCSAGAMCGALIAQGHPAEESIEIATTLWTAEITRRHRWRAIPQMLWPRLAGFDADFALRDDRLILARLSQAFGELRLEDLRQKLRVTATDAATGATVVIDRGRIVDALRASIAMPFMFAPHHIGGQRLVDGFVSDPLPVSAAQDASAVIAFGFDAPLPTRVDGPSRMLAQVTSAMTNNLMHARLAAAESSGMELLRVFPALKRRVGLFDTDALPYLVEEGRRAAEAALPALAALLERTSGRLAPSSRNEARGPTAGRAFNDQQEYIGS